MFDFCPTAGVWKQQTNLFSMIYQSKIYTLAQSMFYDFHLLTVYEKHTWGRKETLLYWYFALF